MAGHRYIGLEMSADLDQVRTKGGTAEQASVPDWMGASLYPEQDR